MIFFPKLFLNLIITGSIGLTLAGTVILIVLVLRDFKNGTIW